METPCLRVHRWYLDTMAASGSMALTIWLCAGFCVGRTAVGRTYHLLMDPNSGA